MIVLALDTALAATSVALLDDELVLARRQELMERGHQERLACLVRDTLLDAALPFSAIDRIGVTVGPGSFTGLRVGLAFAKGLALSLNIPCVGIGTLEALAASTKRSGVVVAAIDARRGGVYLQAFENESALGAAQALSTDEVIALITSYKPGPVTVVGPATDLLNGVTGVTRLIVASPDPTDIARLAWRAPEPHSPAKPLYLRAPDAKTLADRYSPG